MNKSHIWLRVCAPVKEINCYGMFSGGNSIPPPGSTGPQCELKTPLSPIILHCVGPADEEASFTTGHPIGLIYGDANKGRKPLSFTCIRGLRFTVNGNIQPFGS